MIRILSPGVVIALAMLAASPADETQPSKNTQAPLELVLIGQDKLARFEIHTEVEGVAVGAIWDQTFAKLFDYFDLNSDKALDAKEVTRLPSARALRMAMGNGFTPPVGAAPSLAQLDTDKDGKVSLDELVRYYRANGVGTVHLGAGRLPAGEELTAALLKRLDSDGDGKVSEKEWAAAAETLKRLDANDDELIGAGELVDKTIYPGAAGTLLLTPPKAGTPYSEALAKLPVFVLPTDPKDDAWAHELAKRNKAFKPAELLRWRNNKPDGSWRIRLNDKSGDAEPFSMATGLLRVDGWIAKGMVNDALASARTQLLAQLSGEAPKVGKRPGRGSAGVEWLVPIADRNGDGKVDNNELDAWLALQAQIARGQVLLTVLDGGGLFELLDANHDGALSVRELRNARERIKQAGCETAGAFDAKKLPRTILIAASRGYPETLARSARRGPAWFQSMDRNGDGDVSRREFTGPAGAFDRLDLDKDGLISAEEAEKAKLKQK